MTALKPGARFCPQCGQAVEAQSRRRRRGAPWVAVIIGVLVATGAFKRLSHRPSSNPPPAPAVQTTDLDRRIANQLASCSRDIDQLSRRNAAAQVARNNIARSLPDIQNFDSRLKTAIERADDEGRWPVHVAGRTFDRPVAVATVSRLDDYLNRATRAMDDHDRAISEYDAASQNLDSCNKQLAMLRARLQAGVSGRDAADLGANFSRIDAELSRTSRQVKAPASFTPLDLDALLK